MSLRLFVVAMMLATAAALGMIGYQVALPPRQVVVQPLQPAPAPLPVTVGYLAAARNLPAGTLARDEDFIVKSVPAGDVPAQAILAESDARAGIRGALIRNYLEAGAPITAVDVLRPRDRGFLAAVLAPGTRAISVGVDAVSGVAGLIWPGDRVDVILTQEMDQNVAPLSKRVLSEAVLQDARVIAVDQEIVQGASSTAGVAGKLARTVTLQVTSEQAEKLAVAQRLGHLGLAIRSAADQPNPASTTNGTVFSADVSPALSQTDRPVGARVQVIQGDKRNEVNFR
jgi:pilus assembly protein CpaB